MDRKLVIIWYTLQHNALASLKFPTIFKYCSKKLGDKGRLFQHFSCIPRTECLLMHYWMKNYSEAKLQKVTQSSKQIFLLSFKWYPLDHFVIIAANRTENLKS